MQKWDPYNIPVSAFLGWNNMKATKPTLHLTGFWRFKLQSSCLHNSPLHQLSSPLLPFFFLIPKWIADSRQLSVLSVERRHLARDGAVVPHRSVTVHREVWETACLKEAAEKKKKNQVCGCVCTNGAAPAVGARPTGLWGPSFRY